MAFKTKKIRKKVPKTTQDFLPYIECYENGMMQIETGRFSKTMELSDISFKTQSDEEQEAVYENYLKLLNSLNAGGDLFFTFVNTRQNVSETLEAVLPQVTGDKHDHFRNEMTKVIKDKVTAGRNSLKTTKYATVRLDAPSVDEAIKKMNSLEQSFSSFYKKITKAAPTPLNLPERLRLTDTILNGNRANPWFLQQNGHVTLDYQAMKKQGMTTKDIIATEALRFNGNHFVIGDRYGQAFYLDSIANWMNTNFIAELSEINFESCFTLHIEPIPQQDALKMVHNQSVNINAEYIQKEDKGYVSTDVKLAAEQIEDLQQDLMNRDQKLFYMSLVLVVFADSKEELKEQSTMIKNISGKYMSRIQPLIMQQERGLTTALPFGINKTYTKRLMTTESLGVFIPFDEVSMFDEGGFYYGNNAINKSPIIYNRKKGQNYNGLVFGSSGSGKSMYAKQEMVDVFLMNPADDIYIIDPDGEYTPLADAFDGSVIKIAPGNGVYINPFDLDIDISYDNDLNPLTMKTDFICGMIETMLGNNAKLTPTQRSIMDRCIQQIYKPYLEHLAELPPMAGGKKKTIDREYCPTMQNLFDALLSQKQPEAQQLALIMETYTTGTFDTFAHRTNVDLTNRMIIYDIKNIGSNLRELALKVCMNDIWNKMMGNRRQNKWTWFYVDEFHLLMNNDSTSEFLKTVWKRARKWQGLPTGITQNVEDLLASQAARAIINNSSFICMLNQSKMDRDMLAELVGLSKNDIEYITNAECGSGLLHTSRQTIPFTNHFPEDTELFKIMTTKANDDTV